MQLSSSKRKTFLSFQPPAIGPEEVAAVTETLESGWLTSGPRAEELERRLTDRTRLVAVAHVSNSLGTINPVGRIVELAGRYGTTLPADPDSLALAKFLAERRAADPDRFPDLSLSIVKLMGPGIYALDLPGKDPGGHFGLATHDYSHATAPNRRYADLVTQRLVKAALTDKPAPYSNDELASVAERCTEREDAENKVERTIRKTVAALLLRDRIGETFDGIVTGANEKGTFVRTIRPPAEGMVVRHHEGFDVGDRVRVKLVGADPNRGFIDFEGRGER